MTPSLLSFRSAALGIAVASSGLLSALALSSCTSSGPAPAPVASTVAQVAPTATAAATAAIVSRKPSEYDVMELTPIMNRMLRGGRDYERGKQVFQTHACAFCHRFGEGPGGIGPDISGVGGRMGTDGLLTEIIHPSEHVSDLFGKTRIVTKSGEIYSGRDMRDDANSVHLVLNYTVDPSTMTFTWNGGNEVRIKNEDIVSKEELDSEDSPMPNGLVDDLKEDELADLLAFLITGGNPSHRMFQPLTPAPAR
jgi:putative heme-binding domain-containing protein